jgi:hypothetical protein
MILAAGRRFDAGCDIHGPRFLALNSFPDVVRIQPAREDQRSRNMRGLRPIVSRTVYQDRLGGVVGNLVPFLGNPERFPDADRARVERRRFPAVKLGDIEAEPPRTRPLSRFRKEPRRARVRARPQSRTAGSRDKK